MDIATRKLDEVLVTGELTSIDQGTAIVYDADDDRYLYFMMRAVYAINPDTGFSTKLADIPAPVASIENRVAFFPKLGGIAYLPRYSSNVRFLPTR